MRRILYLVLILVFAIIFISCKGKSTPGLVTPDPFLTLTLTQTSTPTPHITNTTASPTLTPTTTPTQAATLTSQPSLEPDQTNDVLKTLLQEPGDCMAPCFWDIMPGKTTFAEAEKFFAGLGLQMEFTNSRDNKKFYEIIYEFESGLTVSPLLTIRDDLVKNLRVYITPEEYSEGMPKEWLVYSPETLISQYGVPTKVDFWVDYPGDADAEPKAWYWMTMYFDPVELIVQYGRPEIKPPLSLLSVCPLTDPFYTIQLWLGNEPEYPPQFGISLEEASSLTIEEFAELMKGNPENACFDLRNDAFPQGIVTPSP